MTKKERLHKKKHDARIRKYTKKYPWFSIYSYRGTRRNHIINNKNNPLNFEKYCALLEFPPAWFRTFGDMMLKELNDVIKRDNLKHFNVQQIKSKYAELCFYVGGFNEETQRIINKYGYLSRNICEICGRPDSPIIRDGWIVVMCRKCYEKNKWYKTPYDNVADLSDSRMCDSYTIRRFNKDDGETEITYDISDTADLIRKRWNSRHKVVKGGD